MLFIFALPVMQVILFCLAIGRDPTGLKIAIVNGELKDNQTSCYNWMMGNESTSGCNPTHMACKYLSFLDNETMIQVWYHLLHL